MAPAQSFLGFEQATRDAELAVEELARAARTAKLQAKLAEQAQRAIRKRQEEMAKNTRRWKREEASRKKNDTLTAQCGINWYSRRRDAGIYCTHCKTCGQFLIYTADKNAKPQVCAGREPVAPMVAGAARTKNFRLTARARQANPFFDWASRRPRPARERSATSRL